MYTRSGYTVPMPTLRHATPDHPVAHDAAILRLAKNGVLPEGREAFALENGTRKSVADYGHRNAAGPNFFG